MASSHKSLKFEEVAANMRRYFGSRGSGSRPDALITEETARPSEGDDQEARAAYKKKEETRGGSEEEGPPPQTWWG